MARIRDSCRQILALMRQDPAIQFGFCDSQSVDGEGKPVYDSYKPYFATLEPDALRRNEIFDGLTFVAQFLSVKNVILNVSSVVWRREALARALECLRGRSRALPHGRRLAPLSRGPGCS